MRNLHVANPGQDRSHASGTNGTSDQKRILVGLGEAELDTFFPAGLPQDDERLCWKVLDTKHLDDDSWVEALREFEPEILLSGWSTPKLTEEIIDSPWFKIKYCCHLTGSVRNTLPARAFEKGMLVTNWGRLASTPVAEHALLLTLACLRRLPSWKTVMKLPLDEFIKERASLHTRTLIGKRVGLHGFGFVAREIVRLLRPFEVQVSSYSAGVPTEFFREHDVEPVDSIEELFASNEVIIECEALTPETQGSVGAELLDLLQPKSVFVNVGRGAVVDEDALVQRIKRGDIRVGLDVYSEEPLPLDSQLHDLKDVILSPHIAGPTEDVRPRCGLFALENISRYLRDEPLNSQVDLVAYLRST
ncbi:MAG: hydroxyacid dehydrogenase [Puniceicoccales bacterium]